MTTPPEFNLVLRYDEFGPPRETLKLLETRIEPRAPEKLRVAMHFAPINPSDLIPITGAYSHLITPPVVAGYEGVGTVIEAPDNYAHLVGRRVLPLRGEGTWQSIVHCDPEIAVPVPDDVPDELAARGYINPVSAYYLLKQWPVTGKRVVLTGAGSLIAALLAQWARNAGAKEVIGIYRSEARRAWLEGLGVFPIDEANELQIQNVARSADVVFDAVGGPQGQRILNIMKQGAEFVGYGLLSGQAVWPSQSTQAEMRRFHLRDYLNGLSPSDWQNIFQEIWPQLLDATLPGVDVFPVQEWQAALDAFDGPGRSGKPLISFI